jgi:hypothetical protein
MPDLRDDFIPDIHISDESAAELPLTDFDLLIIVEPDPEHYLLAPDNEEALQVVLDHLLEEFNEELGQDLFDSEEAPPLPGPRLAWLSYEADDYFITFMEDNPVSVYFRLEDAADLEAFEDYLTGASSNHPDWRVGVFGGMYEDDVMRVAGMVQEAGLQTTVLKRYCLSSKSFVDLSTITEEERQALMEQMEDLESSFWEDEEDIF